MEHGASECVQKQLDTGITIKIEVEEAGPSNACVEIEIDVNYLKREPGLEQLPKSEPELSIKKEIPEDSRQGTEEQQGDTTTSTCTIVGRTSVAADSAEHGKLLQIKEEREDTDLNIGPSLLHHMDSHYRTDQMDFNDTKQKKTVHNLAPEKVLPIIIDDGQVVRSQVSDEATESSWKDNAALAQYNNITSKKGVLQSQSYRCKVCKENFESQLYLSVHTEQVHGGEEQNHQNYKCDKCRKIYKSEIYLWRHNKQVHGTESHKCTHCNKEFKCREYLLSHFRYIHSKEQYECNICKKQCKSDMILQNHVARFHRYRFADPEGNKYRCDKCMKTFQSRRVFERHCEDIHGTERYKCTECNKEYKCMRYLRTHIINVHGSHADNYTCDYCQKSFWKKLVLRQHITGVHGDRVHRCRKCNKIFKCKYQLRQHKKRIHGKPQHKCKVCHRLFTTGCIMRAHIKSSHGTDDFQSKSDSRSQEVHDQSPIASDMSAPVSAGTQQHGVDAVKPEPANGELELGPVVLQHMDSNYRTCKEEPQCD